MKVDLVLNILFRLDELNDSDIKNLDFLYECLEELDFKSMLSYLVKHFVLDNSLKDRFKTIVYEIEILLKAALLCN